MPRPRAYIETTIPSAYHERRGGPKVAAKRAATRHWWSSAGETYELVTSRLVIQELSAGPAERREEWLSLVRELPLLRSTPKIISTVQVYLNQKLMPAVPPTDAYHLAFASFHRCEYLVTWNMRHLANENKFEHIRRVNEALGLFVPSIVTPRQLIGGADE